MINFENEVINEVVFELRFKPVASIVSEFGRWADQLSSEFKLEHWRISGNRIDVYDKIAREISSERIFLTVKNCGVVIVNNSSPKSFTDKAKKLIKFLMAQDVFRGSIHVRRIGLRGDFCNPTKSEFEELFMRYLEVYGQPNPQVAKSYNAKIVDIGMPLTLEVEGSRVDSMAGPMKKDQLKTVFTNPDQHSKIDQDTFNVGLFVQLDRSKLYESKKFKLGELGTLIDTYSEYVHESNRLVRDLFEGE